MASLKLTWQGVRVLKLRAERRGEIFLVVDIRQGEDEHQWSSGIHRGVREGGERIDITDPPVYFPLQPDKPFVLSATLWDSDGEQKEILLKIGQKLVGKAFDALAGPAGSIAAKIGSKLVKKISDGIRDSDALGHETVILQLNRMGAETIVVGGVDNKDKNSGIAWVRLEVV